jgi:hypothetical protein
MREAQSHLDRLLAERAPVGDAMGRYANGVAWRVTVTPLGRFGGPSEMTSEPARVTLVATDGRGRRLVSFDTFSLVSAAARRRPP